MGSTEERSILWRRFYPFPRWIATPREKRRALSARTQAGTPKSRERRAHKDMSKPQQLGLLLEE